MKLPRTFPGHRRRYREYVGLKDTRENRRATAGIVSEIEWRLLLENLTIRGVFPPAGTSSFSACSPLRSLKILPARNFGPSRNQVVGPMARAQLCAATHRPSRQFGGIFFLALGLR
jgi:hypothetical protein